MSDFLLHIAIISFIYGIVSLSLNFQAGVSGMMNFGQIAFFGIGGYAAAISANAGCSVPVGICIGMLVAVFGGALVGRLGRNLGAEYWAIATLGIAEIFRITLVNEGWATGGAGGTRSAIRLFPMLEGRMQLLAILGTVALCLFVCLAVVRQLTERQFGRMMRLLREQPELSMSFGHDVVGCKVRAMAIGAGIAALGGALSTYYIAYISPGDLVPFGTFLIWTMVIIGGIGNHWGSVLGAFVVQFIFVAALFLKDALGFPSELAGALRTMIIGILLLTFLMVRPNGGIPERVRKINAQD